MMVKFKVLQVIDSVKQRSQVKIGAVLNGDLSSNGKLVYFTDKANCEWIFYVGDTCEIVKE